MCTGESSPNGYQLVDIPERHYLARFANDHKIEYLDTYLFVSNQLSKESVTADRFILSRKYAYYNANGINLLAHAIANQIKSEGNILN